MANVVKKDGNQPQAQPQQGQPRGEVMRREAEVRDPLQLLARNPFQLMRELMADPFRTFQMAPFGGFDIRETDEAFVFKADVPGVRNEDIDISLEGNQLEISGKREHEERQEEGGKVHAYERSFGSFSRSFTLPESADLDNIRSDLKDGVLTLMVPKKPGSSTQRRKIQIGSGSKS